MGAGGSTSLTKVMQSPAEAFVDYLQRLGSAINITILDPETRESLIEIVTFENKNSECKRAIRALKT